MNSTANRLRRWSRNVHRELSFFFSGMLLIYAVSGLVMNHRDTINPNYSVEQRRYVVGEPLPARDRLTRDDVVRLLAPLETSPDLLAQTHPAFFDRGQDVKKWRISDPFGAWTVEKAWPAADSPSAPFL